MIISTGVEKAFNKIKHSFAIKKKNTQQSHNRREFHKLDKEHVYTHS